MFMRKDDHKLALVMEILTFHYSRSIVTLRSSKHFFIHRVGMLITVKTLMEGFPGGAVVENLPANAGDTGSSPGLGRSHMPRSN